MDVTPTTDDTSVDTLSYDESTPYSEQVASTFNESGQSSLADRIGSTKVYLLPETAGARGKRKRGGDDETAEDQLEDVDMSGEGLPYRDNAILLRGAPISHLPTSNIFAYATHFDANPMGLEWVDDTTCVLVFPSSSTARDAFRHLTKSVVETPSEDDGSITAKPIPVAIWPPEERINKSLGMGEGLKGVIRMRWATRDDVKKKGSVKDSQFYKKYGIAAGKEGYVDTTPRGGDSHASKRRRGGDFDDQVEKAHLDDEIDAFLAEDDTEVPQPPSPPSKMRSDYIGARGKTLLERTSVIRARPEVRPRGPRSSGERIGGRGPRRGRDERTQRRGERPKRTAQDLDDELDAFLNAKD